MGLPAAVFGLISGVYVDRFNKKMLLIATTLIRLSLIIILLFCGFAPVPVYILVALVSAISQFFIPAEAALIPRFVPENLLLSANSLFTLTFYSAVIGGFVAGGPLLAYLGPTHSIWFIILLFLIATIFLVLLPETSPVSSKKTTLNVSQLFSDIKECFVFIKKTVLVGNAIILLTLAQTIIAIFATLAPGFADRLLLVKLTDASVIILGPAAIGMIMGAVFIGNISLKFAKRTLVTYGILASGILLILVVLIISLPGRDPVNNFFRTLGVDIKTVIVPAAVATFFLLGFANSIIDVTCNTVLQQRTTDEVRGKVYGLLASLVGGIAIFPVIITGVIADLFGVGRIFFILGAGLIVIGIVMKRMIIMDHPNREALFDR